jgi:hypothetical protein
MLVQVFWTRYIIERVDANSVARLNSILSQAGHHSSHVDFSISCCYPAAAIVGIYPDLPRAQ